MASSWSICDVIGVSFLGEPEGFLQAAPCVAGGGTHGRRRDAEMVGALADGVPQDVEQHGDVPLPLGQGLDRLEEGDALLQLADRVDRLAQYGRLEAAVSTSASRRPRARPTSTVRFFITCQA